MISIAVKKEGNASVPRKCRPLTVRKPIQKGEEARQGRACKCSKPNENGHAKRHK